MSAVEEIESAIANLGALKDSATPKPWHKWTDDLTGIVDIWHDLEVRSHVAEFGKHEEPRTHFDAQLVVTLHRTIDAQLAILRVALRVFRHYEDDELRALDMDKAALALARAINSTTS